MKRSTKHTLLGSSVTLLAVGIIFLIFFRRDEIPVQDLQVTAAPKGEVETQAPEAETSPAVERKGPDTEALETTRSMLKNNLSALYTGQRLFHEEYKRYTTDLVFIGPILTPNTNFKYGFVRPYRDVDTIIVEGAAEDPMRMTSDDVMSFETESSYTPEAEAIDLRSFASYCKKGCTASGNQFEILIVAPLPNGKFDAWVIDEEKKIQQVLDGSK